MDDAEIVRRIRSGEADAWSALVRGYERLVYAIPRRMGLSQADVEEVFQNTWLLAHEHIRHLRETSRLRSWISTTAMRESWRLNRRARPEAGLDVHDLTDGEDGPDAAVELLEVRAEVQRGLATLRAPCRELLTLLFYGAQQPSYTDVAQQMGIPVGSLGPTRARCLADLARYLEQRGLRGEGHAGTGSDGSLAEHESR